MVRFSPLPAGAVRTLCTVLELPDADIRNLINELSSICIISDLPAVMDDLIKQQNWPVIAALIQLYHHKGSLTDQPLTTSPYIDQVAQAVKTYFYSQKNSSLEDTKLGLLRSLLEQTFSARYPLGRFLRTGDLNTFNERNFTRIRFVSDIRPVFDSDEQLSEPIGAVLIHMMGIVFQNRLTRSYEDFFVALDTEELYEVKESVDRAIAKAKILEKALESFGRTKNNNVEGAE